MERADSPNTTTLPRISFSSVNAVPPRRRHTTPLPAVQTAHQALIAALAAETPHQIIGYAADRFDILERADHLKTVLAAVTAYAKAISGPAKQSRQRSRPSLLSRRQCSWSCSKACRRCQHAGRRVARDSGASPDMSG
jgi:hypothetical protein